MFASLAPGSCKLQGASGLPCCPVELPGRAPARLHRPMHDDDTPTQRPPCRRMLECSHVAVRQAHLKALGSGSVTLCKIPDSNVRCFAEGAASIYKLFQMGLANCCTAAQQYAIPALPLGWPYLTSCAPCWYCGRNGAGPPACPEAGDWQACTSPAGSTW